MAMMLQRRAMLLAGLAAALVRPARAAPSHLPAGYFRHPASARAIGRAYLAAVPAEADAARIAALLALGPASGASPAALRRRMAARLRADFAAGRTIVLDGWLLAESEARLCALVALG
jgi:DNA-binding IclR family transcriptional regulator